ncbi:E3 ubiquitin-protein ligase RNF26 [Protopterus annectens]|uniref:E3 ubiquitin-protein ligase RNF26 n=1 Tax=Protopterus annectens TaxID=7888 RepID=UPI001CF948A6|nr:E3 ubiquitin-protein ligase RNF26 [Protopterus annectens]
MESVFLVLDVIKFALDITLFLLDVNFWIVSSFVNIILRLIAIVYHFPSTVLSGLAYCGNTVLLSMATVADMAFRVVHNSLQTLTNAYGVVAESFKVFGHLSSYVAVRSKELMSRGVLTIALSGQSLVRQACDLFGIVLSLLAYFINTVINVCLIGTQNLLSSLLTFWDVILLTLLRTSDFVSAFLSHLSSGAVAVIILLWTPCQITIDFLFPVIRCLLNLVLLNLYGLVLMVLILTISTLYLNPEFSARVLDRLTEYMNSVPSLQRIWRDVCQVFRVALRIVEAMLNTETWQSLSRRRYQRRSRHTGTERNDNQMVIPIARQATAAEGEQAYNQVGGNGLGGELHPNQSVNPHSVPAHSQGSRSNSGDHSAQIPSTSRPSSKPGSKSDAVDRSSEAAPQEELWSLLKEQEERKKCVICQDQVKTVLLLPCRHLCLCGDCKDLLMRQPIYQHNCPLCRHLILQTLDVYL